MLPDSSERPRYLWGSRTLNEEACGAGFLFFSGVGWGCFISSSWLIGGFVQAVAFGLLGRMAWEARCDRS